MDSATKKELMKHACEVRMGIIEATYNAKSGHPGGSLSIADLLTYLYYKVMKIDPSNPQWEERDRFVLSKGHTAPGWYSVLANKGYFPAEELKGLRQYGRLLQGHPDMKHIPGVDMSTGSLGQGISVACGMALSSKISNAGYRVFSVMGDGEIEEGQGWEAAMFAGFRKLDNLIAIVDNNGLQIDGKIDEVNSPYPIDEKFKAFNWHVICLDDAHDFDKIEAAFNEALSVTGKPVVIVQKSVKGKGVSFMENSAAWHGTAPNQEQYEQAMSELKAAYAAIQ